MIKISTQEEYMSIVLGEDAKLWIEHSSDLMQSGSEMRIQFHTFRPTPLDVLPTYAAPEAADAAPSWPPSPMAATLYLSSEDLDSAARSKRLLVTRRGCKDLVGFVTGPDTDTDGLAVVQLSQIEEKARITLPAGVELVISSESSSSVTGLVD